MKKLTREEFIFRSNLKHGNKYIYDMVYYRSSSIKVKILCDIHGEFEQTPNSHLMGSGCPRCSGNNKSTKEEFIRKANFKHSNKYSYTNVEYVNSHTKVNIECPIHGFFSQKPSSHLLYGCEKCGYIKSGEKNSKSIDDFISLSNQVHSNKYDYSMVKYINNKKKVKILCPIHGFFEQIPYSHIKGAGCEKCGFKDRADVNRKGVEQFIEDSNRVHNGKYDYSLVEYICADFKVKIICPIHGIFEQRAYKHLQKQGCPICSESKLEREIRCLLMKEGINFNQQYGKLNDSFYLKGQMLDFYLLDYNLAIECQGDQHFRPVDFGNRGYEYAFESFRKNLIRDFNKYLKCKSYGVEIIYYCSESYLDDDYFGEMYSNLNDIIKRIKRND